MSIRPTINQKWRESAFASIGIEHELASQGLVRFWYTFLHKSGPVFVACRMAFWLDLNSFFAECDVGKQCLLAGAGILDLVSNSNRRMNVTGTVWNAGGRFTTMYYCQTIAYHHTKAEQVSPRQKNFAGNSRDPWFFNGTLSFYVPSLCVWALQNRLNSNQSESERSRKIRKNRQQLWISKKSSIVVLSSIRYDCYFVIQPLQVSYRTCHPQRERYHRDLLIPPREPCRPFVASGPVVFPQICQRWRQS